MSKVLKISPGHWYKTNSGASGILNEVQEARKVVNKVVSILKEHKVSVVHIEDNQSTNQKDNLNYLIGQHKKYAGALDVSIHFNSSVGTYDRAIGTEVFYKDSTMKAHATVLSNIMAKEGEFIDRGAKYRDNLGFLLNLKNSVLLEVCFVNSKKDAELYNKNFDKICFGIAKHLALMVDVVIPDKKDYSKSIGKNIKKDSKAFRIHTTAFDTKKEAELNAVGYVKNGLFRYAEVFGNNKDKYRLQSGKYDTLELAEAACINILDNKNKIEKELKLKPMSYLSIIGTIK